MTTETLSPPYQDDNPYDVLFDSSSPEIPTGPNDVNRAVEAAAVRKPNLQQVLGSIDKDSAGMYRPNEAQTRELVNVLGEWQGFGAYEQSEGSLHDAVAKSKDLVAKGLAERLLSDASFVRNEVERDLIGGLRSQVVTLNGVKLAVSPDRIIGAQGFDSWQGRDYGGSETVRDRQTGERRTSLDQIFDYATRDTEIPPMDTAVIFITDEGMFVYAGNAHRAAAAKLRNRPVQVSTFKLFDLRGVLLDASQKQALVEAQTALPAH